MRTLVMKQMNEQLYEQILNISFVLHPLLKTDSKT